ncbi:HAMP domain-containing sensor histidine kinase [Nonomuraea sp. NPDC005983]|uniref:HAMP domain-containing sensor histidine kinase n=1 Tax=Nonomuraea sp. NPDC005983 TaxID=3155595 RepID=UPI0033A04540
MIWKIGALVVAAACTVAIAVGLLVHKSTFDRAYGIARERALEAVDTGTPVDDPPAPLRDVAPGQRVTWYDDSGRHGPVMWAAKREGDHVRAVWIDMGGDQRNLEAFDRSMAKAGLVALAVVVPATALVVARLSRRLRLVAGTARRIADGDLDARIGPSNGRDEIAEISTAVDSMAAALQQRLHSEQRFTADVAHELRTPLMGLVTSAELLPEGQATDYVRDRVRVLRHLIEDLLEISRLDAGAEQPQLSTVPLGPMVAESVRRTGLPVRLEVIGEPTAVTDPRRLDRILTNLVTNAHRHGKEPVEVLIGDGAIAVRDHGPGFPADLLAEGPQRFRGQGQGLGLTIALGQARVIGARLELANAPDGGAVARLELADAPDGGAVALLDLIPG